MISSLQILPYLPLEHSEAEQFLWEQFRLHYGTKVSSQRLMELQERFKKERLDPLYSFFIALEGEEIVGCIALSPYDQRISSLRLRYAEGFVGEIGRCYVKESLQRQGIGSFLFKQALQRAQEIGYETLYLHTHPFLSGGFDFWKKRGFQALFKEEGEWQTIHMERGVED